MDFSKLLDTSSIKNLKCSSCENYLSFFPIYSTTGQENFCGRCSKSMSTSYMVRNEIYEILASQIRFPCKYNKSGCVEKLLPTDIPDHEETCPLRVVNCPASVFDQCDKIISLPKLEDHCIEEHLDFILEEGDVFQFNLSVSSEKSDILIHDSNFYIFQTNFNRDNCKFRYRLTSFEYNKPNSATQYQICLSMRSKCFTCKNSIDEEMEISLKNFENSVNGEIIFYEKTNLINSSADLQAKVLKTVTCSNCLEYIRPPIIFHKCEENKAGLYLDKLLRNLDYPCKNAKCGCSVTGKLTNLRHHENYECEYSLILCPLSNICNWQQCKKDLIEHLKEEHFQNFASSPKFKEDYTWNSGLVFQKDYIIKFGVNYFVLKFSAEQESFSWFLEMVGEYQDSFFFELELGENHKKLITRRCISDESCYFRSDQIFKEVVDEEDYIRYKIRIIKNQN